ncbi:hypothetical protein [uncultured Dysosmobacter sp.]|uniref:hypothetical protein n=1 Tax=uncultured Dysosmobacter sp. TaxID=2591384 RepID=UPI00260F37D3|nr:hypothetical protein [uncultured Dysosmobacter sp.]
MNNLMLFAKKVIYTLLFGLPLTIWLLLRDRRTIYFIPHIGLGDYCIVLGYLEEYKKQHNIHHITLVAPPNRKEVAQFYPYWDSLLVLKNPLYLGIIHFSGIPIGRTIHRKLKRIEHIVYDIPMEGLARYPSAPVDDVVKKFLDLPSTERRKGPHVPQTDIFGLIEKYDLAHRNTVLLNPYTGGQSVKEIDAVFFVMLAKALKANGFSVVTILGSEKQTAVSGTMGMVTSLAEAWYLAQWCGYVIGMRSGFFDFIRMSDCNVIGIYDPSYKFRELFSLHLPGKDERLLELVWTKDNEKELTDKICSACQEWRMSEERQ